MHSRFAIWTAISLSFLVNLCSAQTDIDLKEFVKESAGRFSYGAYFGNKKVGWITEETRLGTHEGQDVAIVEANGVFAMVLLGAETRSEFSSRQIYSLEGEGVLLYAEDKNKQDDEATTHRGRLKEDRFEVTVITDGEETKRIVPVPKDCLSRLVKLQSWLVTPPKGGDTFETYSIDLETNDETIDSEETLTFLSREEVRWGGVLMPVFRVEVDSDDLSYEMSVLSNGSMHAGKIGPLDLRLEEEDIAKDFSASTIDLLWEVPVNRDLGAPEKVEGLTLEVTGFGDFEFFNSHRQELTQDGDRFLLELRRDSKVETPSPLSEAEIAEYTRSTPQIQCDHEKIQKLSAEIIGDETDPVKKASQLQRWVFNNLAGSYKSNAVTALRVLENRAGDCTEHSLLFVSLARAAGLPAREVGGLMYGGQGQQGPYFAWHAWAEIHDGRQWVSIDPTWNEVYVDATHIKLSEDPEDSHWISLMSQLKFKVKKSRIRQ